MNTNRMIALAVMDSIDFMDPTNSREVRPSQRMRRSRLSAASVVGWALLAAIVLLALAAGAR